jgi:hypothetical protein
MIISAKFISRLFSIAGIGIDRLQKQSPDDVSLAGGVYNTSRGGTF